MIKHFIREERGAVTVDWTVLSAAAVGMALATVAIMNITIDDLEGRMDGELRSRQLSDQYIGYHQAHFELLLQTGLVTDEQARETFDLANSMMNHQIITELADGIAEMEAGTLTDQELVNLLAMASVASQRNIVDDAILEENFGITPGGNNYDVTVDDAGNVSVSPTQ
ncbi:hypothetical protein V8J82_17640 [Gymnodinialimonas sp. 2305UL16-5]|uniref:hypothetical protein n=1 Tax=Gymnodinialimonas mytili TaxID=3126503 RepID=UPI0030B240F3